MKKSILLALAALALLATGCKKENPAAWIEGTHWHYQETRQDGYKYNCGLTLRKGSELSITFKNGYYASGDYRYTVTAYTYDGDKSGTLTLRGLNYYAEANATARFTLTYDQKQMHLSTPNGTYTLTRTK
jgi:hypothetical protein